MKIHLLHGIHTAENGGNVSRLIPYLEYNTGLEVMYHQYGWAYAILSRFQNPGRAAKIAKYIEPGDICVGHSNGCAVIYLMAEKEEAPINGAVMINPALKRTLLFPKQLNFIHVYFNVGDETVSYANLFAHPWGDMGQRGYKGPEDRRVSNYDCYDFPDLPIVMGHSDIFRANTLRDWGPFIADQINQEIRTQEEKDANPIGAEV